MKQKRILSFSLLSAFVIWTLLVAHVDVQPIGPMGSEVGFAALNKAVHGMIGVHMPLYVITDWLSLIPVGFAFGFALLGLIQWIRRKRITAVDRSILVLGGFYLVVMAAYLFFEQTVINYRPVLMGGVLEASYPSSTTVLVLCIMPTAVMQLKTRLKHSRCITLLLWAFTLLMVAGRLLSGVHWVTDIIGGVLLSSGLVLAYAALS